MKNLRLFQGIQWSLQLIEYIPLEDRECAIIITEFIPGMNLFQLISDGDDQILAGKKEALSEKEGVTITLKIA